MNYAISAAFSSIISCVLIDNYIPTMIFPGAIAVAHMRMEKKKILPKVSRMGSSSTIGWAFLAPIFVILSIAGVCLKFGLVKFIINIDIFNNVQSMSDMDIFFYSLFITFPRLLINNLVWAVWAELGWRGYMLTEIRKSIPSFVGRAFLTALGWVSWKVPFYVRGGMPSDQYIVAALTTIAMSIFFSYLYEEENTLWPSSVAYATHNIVFKMFPKFTNVYYDQYNIWISQEGVLALLFYTIIAIVCIIKKRNNLNDPI